MKKIVWTLLMTLCLPALVMAQSAEDDLYFVPKKKKAEKKEVKAVPKTEQTTVYAAPGSTVVVKDVKGNVRDVDEYNRRYTSRDNTFSVENDTLYIEEKPYNERGEWINGFEGSESDYEYAMRIVRFRNPRYAIPVSSPLYWDVVYGAYPSWEWNVFDDGMYAYVFPTYSNRLWWDWRYNYPFGASWSFSWGWHSPWHYSGWYAPGYWGGYWGHHHHHHHPHFHPHYSNHGWGGGYWGGGSGWYGSSKRNPGIHAGRYDNNYRPSAGNRGNYTGGSTSRSDRAGYTSANRQSGRNSVNAYRNRSTTTGRVVSGDRNSNSSVRPNRTAVRSRGDGNVSNNRETGNRQNNTYARPAEGRSSSYSRPSSTRSSVSGQRTRAAERGTYRNNSSSRSRSNSSSSYSRSSSSSSRSSYSSGSGSTSRSSAGGGSSRSGGGGRSGGGRTR